MAVPGRAVDLFQSEPKWMTDCPLNLSSPPRHGLKYSRKCSKTYECERICKSTAAGICVLVWATMSAVLSLVTGTVIFRCQARTRKLHGDRWTQSFVWQIGIFAHYVVTVCNTWLASSVTHTHKHTWHSLRPAASHPGSRRISEMQAS